MLKIGSIEKFVNLHQTKNSKAETYMYVRRQQITGFFGALPKKLSPKNSDPKTRKKTEN